MRMRTVLGAMLLAFIFSISIAMVSAANCTDSDNGDDFYVSGVIKSASGGIVCGDKCSDRNTLKECYCNEKGSFGVKQFRCPYRCNDNRCQNASIIRCGDFVCNTNESCSTCQKDCGKCKTSDETNISSGNTTKITEKIPVNLGDQENEKAGHNRIASNDSDCAGCMVEGKCIKYGHRKNRMFCNLDQNMKEEFANGASCKSDYECTSNYCKYDKCTEAGFLKKIMNWLSGN